MAIGVDAERMWTVGPLHFGRIDHAYTYSARSCLYCGRHVHEEDLRVEIDIRLQGGFR
jgi:hypothetical protein